MGFVSFSLMCCLGFCGIVSLMSGFCGGACRLVSRREEPRQGRALAHAALHARRARPGHQVLWPPPAFSGRGAPAECQESQARIWTLGQRRPPAICAGGPPAAAVARNLRFGPPAAAAPRNLRCGSPAAAALGTLRRRLPSAAPAALGRPRLGGARRVGRSGGMSERWCGGRASRDQSTMGS